MLSPPFYLHSVLFVAIIDGSSVEACGLALLARSCACSLACLYACLSSHIYIYIYIYGVTCHEPQMCLMSCFFFFIHIYIYIYITIGRSCDGILTKLRFYHLQCLNRFCALPHKLRRASLRSFRIPWHTSAEDATRLMGKWISMCCVACTDSA